MPESDETIGATPLNISNTPVDSPEAVDRLFACLADHQRRVALQCLSEASRPLVIETLIRGVAERSEMNVATKPREDQKVDVAVSLIHNHLPKMRDAGVVEVDYETNTVQQGSRFETARTLLEAV